MTQYLGLSGAAAYFGAQFSHSELASLEADLFAELASIRLFDDTLETLAQLKDAGLNSRCAPTLAAFSAITSLPKHGHFEKPL
jgi:hypothetical protein